MQNVQELLMNHFFRIPDYQRGYAWDEKNLNDMWDDIEEITLDENGKYKPHYTGTIYVEEIQREEEEFWVKGSSFYSVVDGQQRLTTISILLFELIKSANAFGFCGTSKEDLEKTYLYKTNSTSFTKAYRFSYEKNDQNYSFLLNKIFEDKHIIFSGNDNAYKKRLENAKSFFSEKIRNLDDEAKAIFFEKVSTALYFDLRIIGGSGNRDLLDVQAVFETMNNRGKPLSILEKLKNRLIYLSTKLDIPNEDMMNLRYKINDSWKKIYASLSQGLEEPLDEDVFLSAHLSLIRATKESTFSISRANDKIFKMFCLKADRFSYGWNTEEKESKVNKEKISDYVESLSDLAPLWCKVHNSTNKVIQRILLLSDTQEVKVLLLALLKIVGEDNPIFTKLEKIIFRNILPIGVCDNSVFATNARNLYLGKTTFDVFSKEIDDYISKPITSSYLVSYFKSLYDYIKGNKGFYRWRSLKYFLFRYEDFLKSEYREENDKVYLKDFKDTTIEHIFPNSYEDYWNDEMKSILGEEVDEDKILYIKKVITNTLGNLTILKSCKNSSLNNNSLETKLERYKTGSYNEIQILDIAGEDGEKKWGEAQIIERGKLMLKFMESLIDGLKFSENDIIEILQPYKTKNNYVEEIE